MTPPLVVGIGNPYRRDDGVGHAAARLARHELPEADVVLAAGEPTRLVDLWAGRDLVVVVDAVRGGGPPGSPHRVEVGVDPFPVAAGSHSSHGPGVEAAVGLAGALDRLPSRLVVLGVEPADAGLGRGLSTAVAAALPTLVAMIVAEVRKHSSRAPS